jgi:RNA recognition motif-containing protein
MRKRHHHGNLFVANLPPDFPEERLAEAFDPYGIVLSAAVARDPATGARLRYGWVDIATERAAAGAIAGLHGSEIDGCRIEVRPSEKSDRKSASAARRGPTRRLSPPSPHHSPAPRRPVPPPAAADLSFAPASRPRPQFQVERRALPRRLTPS